MFNIFKSKNFTTPADLFETLKKRYQGVIDENEKRIAELEYRITDLEVENNELKRMVSKPSDVGDNEIPEVFINGRKTIGILCDSHVDITRLTRDIYTIEMTHVIDGDTFTSLVSNGDSGIFKNCSVTISNS